VPVRPRILVVEDDPLVAEVIAAALEDDYVPRLVETSAAAMRCMAEGGINLILLDCTLPDGVDAALIPTADQAQVPVVLMSGDPQRVEGLASKPRPFILKPFSMAELVAAVRRQIDGPAHAPA
jgi:DNA-binding response OmpR family regulator